MNNGILNIFHPLIQNWFKEKIGYPTNVQIKSWEAISDKKHVLITSPTGSGKTFAAFLWAINQLASGIWETGKTSVLYISPLKALNNDIQKNLLGPLKELEEYFKSNNKTFPKINVLTRSGDTSSNDRRRMIQHPPEILITTPESLNIILTSKYSKKNLSFINTVIMDEIHAVIGNKRGVHLITAVDRLILQCGEFQRIAISATVKPVEKIADFIGGYKKIDNIIDSYYEKRKVEIINSENLKEYKLKVCSSNQDYTEDNIIERSYLDLLVDKFINIIKKESPVLFFANSRRQVEKIARFINEKLKENIAYSHHGSLSKEIRIAVEEKFKEGELKALVATNSLELGIDIGELNKVVLIQTPSSVSSAIQRIGRSGHKIDKISKGDLYPIYGRDFIDGAVIANLIINHAIEEIHLIDSPLDVLSQIILSMCTVEEWDIDKLYNFLKTSYPYRNLDRREYDLVIEMLAGRYADSKIRELKNRVSIDKLDNKIKAKEEVPFLIYTSGGTIPDRGYYDLRLQDSRSKIGELDEEFVWERHVGETFAFGNQLWKIQKITHNDVEVVPSDDRLNIIVFWKGEELDRDFHFSRKILEFLEKADKNIANSSFKNVLITDYFMETKSAEKLIDLKLQKEHTNSSLPHRHLMLIEHCEDNEITHDCKQVILHTLWGNKINRPYSYALAGAWEEKYKYPLQVFSNNDCIIINLPHDFKTDDILKMVTSDNFEKLLRIKLESTGFFGAKFRENAGRAILLPKPNFKKRMPLWFTRLRSKKLFEAVSYYEDFPILIETWRTCLQDEFDIENLKLLLDEIKTGEIKLLKVVTRKPSPFVNSLIWRQTNQYMYEDDTPRSTKKSNLMEELINRLIYSANLRPHISPDIIKELNNKLKRTSPGYSPGSSQDLLDWIKERLLIKEDEWVDLLESIKKDHGIEKNELYKHLNEKIVWIKLSNSKYYFISSIETLPLIMKAFRINISDVIISPIEEDDYLKNIVNKHIEKIFKKEIKNEYNFYDFLYQWLSYYCPVKKSELMNILGLNDNFLNENINYLVEKQYIIVDKISDENKVLEVCDIKNLEILLRLARKRREPVFKALNITSLQVFLAYYQGIVHKGNNIEDLQNRIEQLFGLPVRAGAWEEFIFPDRLDPYFINWLDTLMQSSSLLWFGHGKMKICFSFMEDLELFIDQKKETENILMIPNIHGKYSFFDLINFTGFKTSELIKKLWDYTWQGLISNDSFVTIRQGILNNFISDNIENNYENNRRLGFNRWKSTRPVSGNWFVINNNYDTDVLEYEEIIKDRIRQLFKRYGILFRELLVNELPVLQWKNIFKTLRLMELSGEILTGHFFEGINGLQFITYEALRFLQDGLDEDCIYWINAADPASMCGINLEELKKILPARINTTYLVFHGCKLVLLLKKNCKEIEIKVNPNNEYLQKYFSIFNKLLTRQFNPIKKITIQIINNKSFNASEYIDDFKKYGFNMTYKGLELWKKY